MKPEPIKSNSVVVIKRNIRGLGSVPLQYCLGPGCLTCSYQNVGHPGLGFKAYQGPARKKGFILEEAAAMRGLFNSLSTSGSPRGVYGFRDHGLSRDERVGHLTLS